MNTSESLCILIEKIRWKRKINLELLQILSYDNICVKYVTTSLYFYLTEWRRDQTIHAGWQSWGVEES